MGNSLRGRRGIATAGGASRAMGIAGALLALAGCAQTDPLDRPYMWHPADANGHNIAMMAANPADLVRGRETSKRRVAMDSDSVDRLWTGKTPALPSDEPGSSSGGTTAAPSGGASSGASAGGS